MCLGFPSLSEVYVYVTCFLLGISMLMPVNAIFSAPAFLVNYYKYIVGDLNAEPNIPFFWANILTFYSVASLVTQIICAPTVLIPAVRSLSLTSRFVFSFICMMIELLVVVVLPGGYVSQNSAIVAFLIVTVIAGAGKAIYEVTCYALAGCLPPKFMTAVMFGCGSSGLVASILQCIIKASMEDTYESVLTQSHIYFSLALSIMFVSLIMTICLRFNSFARERVAEFRVLGRQHCVEEGCARNGEAAGNVVEPIDDENAKRPPSGDTEGNGPAAVMDESNMTTSQQLAATSVMPVVRLIYPMQIACFCSFFVSLFIFPSLVIPIDRTDKWFATIAILMYNFGDSIGRFSTALERFWPSRRATLIVTLVRFLFVPLIFLCIFKQIPGHVFPYICMFFVGLTNYFGALTMVYGPITKGLVTRGQSIMAGQLMGIALLAGASVASLVAIGVIVLLP